MSEALVKDELLELAARESDGMTVQLLYRKLARAVFVSIEDSRLGENRRFSVPSDRALDAFYHPWAYATDTLAEAAA